MAAPLITAITTVPNRENATNQASFSNDVDTFFSEVNGFQTEANAQAQYLDGVAAQVDASQVAAAASAANASVSETNAAASAATATTKAVEASASAAAALSSEQAAELAKTEIVGLLDLQNIRGSYQSGQPYEIFDVVRDVVDGSWYIVIVPSYTSVSIINDVAANNLKIYQTNVDNLDALLGAKYEAL